MHIYFLAAPRTIYVPIKTHPLLGIVTEIPHKQKTGHPLTWFSNKFFFPLGTETINKCINVLHWENSNKAFKTIPKTRANKFASWPVFCQKFKICNCHTGALLCVDPEQLGWKLTRMTFSMSLEGHQWNIPVESYFFTLTSMFSICSFPGISKGSCLCQKTQRETECWGQWKCTLPIQSGRPTRHWFRIQSECLTHSERHSPHKA